MSSVNVRVRQNRNPLRLGPEVPYYLGAVALAAIIGAAAFNSAILVFAALIVLASGAAMLFMPLRWIVAALLAGMTVMPSLVLGRANGHFSGVPLLGQSTLVAVVAFVCIFRATSQRLTLAFPGAVSGAIALYAATLVFETFVAILQGNTYGGMMSDLLRQLALPLAFVVGFIAGQAAKTGREWIEVMRGIAWVGVAASLLSILYWLWTVGAFHPPLVSGLFGLSQQAGSYSHDRSVFPFAEDGPDLLPIILLGFAAFAAPPLLLTRERRNTRLASLLILVALVGALTTQSRTGLVAVITGPIPFVALMPRTRARQTVLIGLAVLLGGTYFGYHKLFPTGRSLSLQTQTFHYRQEIWHQAYQKFSEKPVLGEGYHYSVVGHFLVQTPDVAAGQATFRYFSVHNDFLGALVDGGIVGALVLLALLLSFLRLGIVLIRTGAARPGGIGLLCFLAVLLPGMLATAILQSSAITMLTFTFVGLAASRYHAAAPDAKADTARDD
jgi:hypothetical protein